MKLLTIIFFLGLSFTVTAQSTGLQKIYTFGAWFDKGDSCSQVINKKYGFKTVDGGCVTTEKKEEHNKKAEELLLKRNGADWRTKYAVDLNNCRTK